MNLESKQQITKLLQAYVQGYSSQKQAINLLEDVSEATVINIINNKWNGISDAMWRNVGKQVGFNERRSKLVETQDFSTLMLYFNIAQEHGETFAVVGPAGSGKTYAARCYTEMMKGRHVYYLECAEYWNKKYFLTELLRSMGRNASGMNVYEMMDEVVSTLRKQHQPLIILDEVDKLKDEVLYFFITLYNKLHGMCGIVWTSTDNIANRIEKGINRNRKGFQEIKSRIGRKFIALNGTSKNEVVQLCEANGITEEIEINRIYNEYGGDLRRIDRFYLKRIVGQSNRSLKKVS
jgi:Cdc6-like AAA superfamily ATPase